MGEEAAGELPLQVLALLLDTRGFAHAPCAIDPPADVEDERDILGGDGAPFIERAGLILGNAPPSMADSLTLSVLLAELEIDDATEDGIVSSLKSAFRGFLRAGG